MYQAWLEREREMNQQKLAQKEERLKLEKPQQQEEERAAGVKRKREYEAKLCTEDAAAKLEYEAGQMIVSEANQKLAASIKDKDFKQTSIAQMMLEQGESKIKESSSCVVKISKERHTSLVNALADSAGQSEKRRKSACE